MTQMQMNGLIPRQSIGRTTRQTKVSFFAYAPYESNVSGGRVGIVTSQIDDTGIPSIDFTLKEATKIDEMVDLVVAEELNKTAQDEAIQFNFRHTLSKINRLIRSLYSMIYYFCIYNA